MNPREICIIEWANACELINERDGLGIIIREPKDAETIIESLQRFVSSFPTYTQTPTITTMPYTEAISRLKRDRDTLIHNASLPDCEDRKVHLNTAYDLQNAISYLRVANLGGLSALVSLIRQWGTDRNIIGKNAKATVHTQFEKLREEFAELEDGLVREDQHAIIDGIGDMTVVLILLAGLAGVRFETCLYAAYDEIKSRRPSARCSACQPPSHRNNLA